MKVVRLRLEYVVAWPNHVGMFLARHKGWYAEKGLDVDLVWGGWDRGTPIDLVNKGEYQFASARLGDLLETRRSETPYVGVATFNQKQLGGVISVASTGISRWRDLEGKKLGASGVPRMLEMVREAVEKDGGNYNKVEVIRTAPYVPDVRAIERGHFDAVFNVLGWESYTGSTPFEDVVQLNLDDMGVTPHHAYFICVPEAYLRENEQLVRDFLAVTSRGYDYAYEHPEEAIEVMARTACDSTPETLAASLAFIKETWHAPSGRWGEMDENLIRSYTQWMISKDATPATLDDIPGAWTNEYLPS